MTKAEWRKQVYADAAEMRREAAIERVAKVKEITDKWKTGFKDLKKENDRLQKELREWWELTRDQIQNYIYENLERGGPFEIPK